MQENPNELTPELLNKVVESQAMKIFNLYLEAINSQITDAVTQLDPSLARKIAKQTALVHVSQMRNPFDAIPKQNLESLNGAAKERLELVVEFWKGVKTFLENLETLES